MGLTMKYRHQIILFFVLVYAGLPLLSQATVTATVKLSSTVLRMGETIPMTLEIASDRGEEIQSPIVPSVQEFSFINQGQSSSTEISISGGQQRMINSLSYNFALTALKEGVFNLTGFGAKTSAGEISANPVKITVLAAGAAAPTPGPQSMTPSQSNQYGLVFQADCNKKEAFAGEEILLTYTLYCPVMAGIQTIQTNKDDRGRLQEFWTETVELGRDYQQKVRAANGEMYYKTPLIRYIIYPLTPGTPKVSPMKINCRVAADRRQSGFFNFPFANLVDVPVESEEVAVHVKPLPEQGKPDTFKGAVGTFKINSSVKSAEMEEGDTVTLKVTLEGSGNLKNAPPPVLPDLSKFVSYEPVKEPNIQVTVDGVRGSIEYSYVLVPNDVNANTIGPVRYSYFDPAQQKYITQETKPILLKINPSKRKGIPGGPVSGMNRRLIAKMGEDFRFNVLGFDTIAMIYLPVYHHAKAWILLFAPLALFILVVGWKRREMFLALNPAIAKSRKAPRLAKKLLADAAKAMKEGNCEKVYAHLYKAVSDYISNRWNIACAGLTSLELQHNLVQNGVTEECIQNVIRTLEEFDGMRFSGAAADSHKFQEDFSKAEKLLADLMNQKNR